MTRHILATSEFSCASCGLLCIASVLQDDDREQKVLIAHTAPECEAFEAANQETFTQAKVLLLEKIRRNHSEAITEKDVTADSDPDSWKEV